MERAAGLPRIAYKFSKFHTYCRPFYLYSGIFTATYIHRLSSNVYRRMDYICEQWSAGYADVFSLFKIPTLYI